MSAPIPDSAIRPISRTNVRHADDRMQENGNLLRDQHFEKLMRLLAGRDVILDGPFPAKRDGVPEPKSGDRKRDETGCQALLLGQVELPSPDFGRSGMFGEL
jgi:hypothetical protein